MSWRLETSEGLGNIMDGGSPIGGVAERQSVVAPDAGFIEAEAVFVTGPCAPVVVTCPTTNAHGV
ncbi:MAG: hypothetical protein ACWGMY_02080 [Hyphomicrobiaceae bacterium]